MDEFKNTVLTKLRITPLGTRTILLLILICHSLQLASTIDTLDICFIPKLIIKESYRVMSFSWFHVSWVHLLLNSLAVFSLIPDLERGHGTLVLLFMTYQFSWIIPVIHYFLALMSVSVGIDGSMTTCSVGFSGILFAYLTIACSTSKYIRYLYLTIRMHGYKIPSIVIPWFHLMLMQILMSNASFLGHVSGILCGYLPQVLPASYFTWPSKWIEGIPSISNKLGSIACFHPWPGPSLPGFVTINLRFCLN